MTSEQEAEAKRWIERLAIHLDSATDILEVEIDEPDDIAEERCFIANAREFLASLAAPPAGPEVNPEPKPTAGQLAAAARFIMGQPGDDQTRTCTCRSYPHLPNCGEPTEEAPEPQHRCAGLRCRVAGCKAWLLADPAGTGGRR